MIIDGTNLILGRLATRVTKLALQGEKIDIVNCEKIVITGRKKYLLEKYKHEKDRGVPSKGPFLSKMPDKFVKKAIKRMLPYKKPRGKEALKNIMCHIRMPDKLKDQKLEQLEEANIKRVPSLKYLTVETICRHLGAKI